VNAGAAVVQNITTGSPGCDTPTVISPTTCTVTVNAPPGNDAFVISTFDQQNAAGNMLSALSFSQTINPGVANIVNVSLGGIPVSLTVTPMPDSPYLVGSTTSGFTSYFTEAHHIAVLSYDADNNPIVGTGVPALSVTGTSGLAITAPVAGTSQNVFTVQNAAFNTTEKLTVTATPVSGTGTNPLTVNVPVSTKHIIVTVLDAAGATLHVYNDDTATPAQTVAVSGGATGFFTDNQGDAVVTFGTSVSVYTGNPLTATYTVSTNLTAARSGCSDHESNIYIANGTGPGGSSVIEYPTGGANTVTNTYSTSLNTPIACVVDVDDSLWVLNNGDSTVTHFAAGGTGVSGTPISTGIAAADAFSLGIDRAGDLYVGFGTGTNAGVQVYPPGATTPAFTLATNAQSDFPSGNSVDIGGSLWVGNFTAGTVERFGAPITSTSPGVAVPYTGTGTNIKLDVTPKALPTTP